MEHKKFFYEFGGFRNYIEIIECQCNNYCIKFLNGIYIGKIFHGIDKQEIKKIK